MSSEPGGESSGFNSEEAALAYLRSHVSIHSEPSVLDLSPLRERLFDIPDEPSEGHHEFVGKNGLRVSYDLVRTDDSFDGCYLDLSGDTSIQGQWKPIFRMLDLTVETANFGYSLKYPASKEHATINSIFWLPKLGSGESELSHDYANLGLSKIYLLGQDGFLSTPIDLIGLGHEIGHIETYPLLPKGAGASTSVMGYPVPRTAMTTAYELQREENANAWMRQNTSKLFDDLGIPTKLIEEYERVQLGSYHNLVRRRFLNSPGSPHSK